MTMRPLAEARTLGKTVRGLSVLCGLAVALAMPSGRADAASATYKIAHTRYQNANMVLVVSGPGFFTAPAEKSRLWYTSIKQCVKGLNLAGEVIVVANSREGRFTWWGPTSWNNFLRTIDMEWVQARVNKQITCNF